MKIRAVPSRHESPWTRREVLAVSSLSIGTLAGCAGLRTQLQERRLGTPDRQVASDWHPEPGQWPLSGYNQAQTSHNPYATPPRDEPEAAWTYEHGHDTIRALVVAEDAVFARTDGELVALSTETGQAQWTRSREHWAGLRYVAGRLYEFGDARIRALTPDGELIWDTALEDDTYYHPIERDGWLSVPGRDTVVRLHADTGDVVSSADLDAAVPTTTGGPVYAGRYAFSAYDVVDGEFSPRWSVDDELGPYESYGPATGANGLLFRPEWRRPGGDEERGRLSVYDAADGTRRTAVSADRTVRSPAVDGRTMYVSTSAVSASDIGTEGRFAALSTDGDEQWSYEPDGSLRPPVSANGTVYVGPFANEQVPLVAFDAATGDELWQGDVSGTPELAIAGETLYVGTSEDVRALRS